MGRRSLLLGLLGLVTVLGMVSGSAAGAPPAVGWQHAVEVPGTATLNSGANAERDLGLVRRGPPLRGRRLLQGRLRPYPGVRGQRDERRLG